MQLSLYLQPSQETQTQLSHHAPLKRYWQYGLAKKLSKTSDALLLEALDLVDGANYPLASLLRQNEKTLITSIGQSCFLVYPVSLMLQRDTIGLTEVLALNKQEYAEATILFNQHFSNDGITFLESDTHQYWYVYLAANHVQTVLPQNAVHQDIHAFQPSGDDATLLKQIMNEAQMLLHDHVINTKRESQQQSPFNSIWVCGNGALPEHVTTPFDALLGSSAMIKGVQQLTSLSLLHDISALNDTQAQQVLMHTQAVDDVDWDTLYQLVKKRRISSLMVYCPFASDTIEITLRPLDCFKLWRKPKQFEQVVKALYDAN